MFKAILEDANEIVKYIILTSPNSVDEELLFEYFFGCMAFFKVVEINTISREDENHHIQSKSKEIIYEKLSLKTMPPLVIENGKLLDGNHRFKIASKNGLKTISVYDVISQ